MKYFNISILFSLLFFLLPALSSGQKRSLSLIDAIEIAQAQCHDAMVARLNFMSQYWSHRSYRAELLPSVNISGGLMEFDRFYDSNDMLSRGVLISNDLMFLILQGNNYCDLDAYRLAEDSYLQAWQTMPNRIYPLYQLIKLYQLEGNKKKMAEYAEKVMNFEEKISSQAVNDMKREAHEIKMYILCPVLWQGIASFSLY